MSMSKVRPPPLGWCIWDGTNWVDIVLLQALKEEPAADAKCKDKFLVQSVAVSRDMEFANVTSIVRSLYPA